MKIIVTCDYDVIPLREARLFNAFKSKDEKHVAVVHVESAAIGLYTSEDLENVHKFLKNLAKYLASETTRTIKIDEDGRIHVNPW